MLVEITVKELFLGEYCRGGCLVVAFAGTLEAYDYSKRCFQIMLSQVGTRGSEDCLYLDLWVPQSGSQGEQQKLCL